ncbi:MAG: hypothetical protein RL038_1106, partial [Actinomycetota bacterium]
MIIRRSADNSFANPEALPTAKSANPIAEIADAEFAELVEGRHYNPHGILGAHQQGELVVFRVLRPFAISVVVTGAEFRLPLTHENRGVWVGAIAADSLPDYRVETRYSDGFTLVDDPYRHLPTIGELDLHLIREGRHEQLSDALGARVMRFDSELGAIEGTAFTVWAPNAKGVQVIGDFNFWDGTTHPMRSLGSAGVWELFIPGIGHGNNYKFRIFNQFGYSDDKADPMARHSEVPPSTASVVWESSYEWQDENWLAQRADSSPQFGPMSVYEVHLGSWKAGLGFKTAAEELRDYVLENGFTHVEFMPLAQHPYAPSWGYQVTGYYAVASALGNPDELKYLIDVLHQAGIGVIMDWVPAHFPKDAWALAKFDGTALYEHEDPRLGEHPDWGTYIFNFGRPEVKNFLVANAVYWLEEFHVDALRVDAVASMLYLDYSRKSGEWMP